ncbi:MAG: DUF1549 domain-containing protein [Planctomycetaceae bacterium]|nr:DUF1549 domain-containing protein [Planctomycetaceae bacterium]
MAHRLFSIVGLVLASFAPATLAGDSPRLTSEDLDRLIAQEMAVDQPADLAADAQFLRRLSLDLVGRQPTPEELRQFLDSKAPDKRDAVIESLLSNPEFGTNWANYWSDTIAYRIPPPELTFLEYGPLKKWLAEKLNSGASWDAIVGEILSASGKVGENPPATFVGYHEGHAARLASETARIFLSLQIGCAQCHDHPFDEWKREQFHELAAYFARVSVKMPWNDGTLVEVSDKGKGEYEMPNVADPTQKGRMMEPVFLSGVKTGTGKSDAERRQELAQLITNPENEWFARSYVNRVWARLFGRGFYEPVDDFGLAIFPVCPDVHIAVSNHFIATGYDVKDLFRLLLKTRIYQQKLGTPDDDHPFVAARTGRLRGDEIFDSLVTAIDLPNVKPEAMKPTKEIRFPPPPKSTRDIIAETFTFDTSLRREDIPRTLSQAMLMMNNDQLQAQVNANPESGTVLARLVKSVNDDRELTERLFELVLARRPSERELQIAVSHRESVPDRGAAYEDLLWGLLNTAEFTTKR